jgi:hypothetical protein
MAKSQVPSLDAKFVDVGMLALPVVFGLAVAWGITKILASKPSQQ